MAMRVSKKQSPRANLLKPQKLRDKPLTTGNKRHAEQVRKILGKHYASKYRVR
jgi:hypothetical protein